MKSNDLERDFKSPEKVGKFFKKCYLVHSILNNSMGIKRMVSKDIRLKKGKFKEGRKDTNNRRLPSSWIKLKGTLFKSIGVGLVSGMA